MLLIFGCMILGLCCLICYCFCFVFMLHAFLVCVVCVWGGYTPPHIWGPGAWPLLPLCLIPPKLLFRRPRGCPFSHYASSHQVYEGSATHVINEGICHACQHAYEQVHMHMWFSMPQFSVLCSAFWTYPAHACSKHWLSSKSPSSCSAWPCISLIKQLQELCKPV